MAFLKMEDAKIIAYINEISSFEVESLIKGKGKYTHYIFSSWTYKSGPLDSLHSLVRGSFGNPIGTVAKLREEGLKVMMACGSEHEVPTGVADPIEYGRKAARFAMDYGFQGLDFKIDNLAFGKQSADWLINATRAAKDVFPDSIISHSPKARYFSPAAFLYLDVHKYVGDLIDFYNIQFFNQQSCFFDTYEQLIHDSGNAQPETSVGQIHANGIPFRKMLITKPVSVKDARDTGYLHPIELATIIRKAASNNLAPGGVAAWQWLNDVQEGGAWSEILIQAFSGATAVMSN